MDNVLIDRSASGFDFSRWSHGDGCRSRSRSRSIAVTSQPPHHGSHSSMLFPYASPLPPFQYTPCMLHSSLSLPPLPPRRRPAVPPLSPAVTVAKYAAPPPAAPAAARRMGVGEYKRKKPRAPRAGGGDEPPRAQRRRPLQRAAPLPPAPAVEAALDDLEREVVRGFVEDLMHVLAPPPSSLPLPTFSLVRTAAAGKATAASCAAV